MGSGATPIAPFLIIAERRANFILRVHHERPVADDWLADRFPGHDQRAGVLEGFERDALTPGTEGGQVKPGSVVPSAKRSAPSSR